MEDKLTAKETERAKRLIEQRKKALARQNKFINEHYDRVSVVIPKGAKERIKALGYTVNSFISEAVMKALQEAEKND